MRQRLLRHRPFRLAIAAMVALALVLQVLPAMAAPVLLDAGSICHAGDDGGTPPPPGTAHDHEHCLLCQAAPVATLPPGPAFLPRPGVAVGHASSPATGLALAAFRPAYSSRAPPEIG